MLNAFVTNKNKVYLFFMKFNLNLLKFNFSRLLVFNG